MQIGSRKAMPKEEPSKTTMWQRDKRIIWTGANSTSPNANQLEESYAERRTQQGNNVTKRQND